MLSERDLVACAGVVEARGDVDDETHVPAHGDYPPDRCDGDDLTRRFAAA